MTDQENLPAVKDETDVDKELVKRAVSQIKFILIENFGNASYQVVDYLLENFFDGKKENLKTKKLVENKSFQGLLAALQDETGRSKSWLYEAIKLWQDREFFKELDKTTNEQYLQLSISHRALLLKVSDPDKKKGFAQIFYNDQVSYKKAKLLVRGEAPDTDYSKLNRIINHFEEFDEESFKEKAGKRNLKALYESLKEDQQFEVVKKANHRVKSINEQIREKQDALERAKSLKKQLEIISEEIGKSEK